MSVRPIEDELRGNPDWVVTGKRAVFRGDPRVGMEERAQGERPCFVMFTGGEDAPNTVHACRDWVEARRVANIVRARGQQ